MKTQPSNAIENGFTAQLTNSVTPIPRQCFADRAEGSEVDLDEHRHNHQPDEHGDRQVDLRDLDGTHGVEDSRRQMPEHYARATMQRATQRVRYRSKTDMGRYRLSG